MDPVTYIVAGLHQNFAQFDEENRLQSLSEFLGFHRRSGETINSMLARYELIRTRGQQEGGIGMTVEGYTTQIFRVLGISTQDMVEYLRPFNGLMPTTEAQFQLLLTNIRRTLRIRENVPGNVGQFIHSNRPTNPNNYHTQIDPSDQLAFHTQQEQSQGSPLWGDQPAQDQGQADASRDAGPADPGSPSYLANAEDETYYSATDSDTSSDDYQNEIDMTDCAGYPDHEVQDYLYQQKRFAKRRWRRFTGRPVRGVRRFIKKRSYFARRKGKGKGRKGSHKGRGKGSLFFTDESEWNEAVNYLSSQGVNVYTSGKGFGRKKNPRGKDGQVMKCFTPGCGSEDHFQKDCPMAQHHFAKGKGKHKGETNGPSLATIGPSPWDFPALENGKVQARDAFFHLCGKC